MVDLSLPNYEMFYQKLGSGNLKIDNIGNKIRKFVFPEEITDEEDIFTPEVKENENSENNEIESTSNVKKNLSEELNKLNNLLKEGVLTQEEFEKAKKKILNN